MKKKETMFRGEMEHFQSIKQKEHFLSCSTDMILYKVFVHCFAEAFHQGKTSLGKARFLLGIARIS